MTLRFAITVLLMFAGFVALFRIAEARRELDNATIAAFGPAGAAELHRKLLQ